MSTFVTQDLTNQKTVEFVAQPSTTLTEEQSFNQVMTTVGLGLLVLLFLIMFLGDYFEKDKKPRGK